MFGLKFPLRPMSLVSVSLRSLHYGSINRISTTTMSMPVRSMVRSTTPLVRSFRSYSVITDECKAKIYDYNEIKKLSSNPSSDFMLVDVREPIEFEQGHIPGAINVPFKSNPGALGLSEEDFEENFGFTKPDPSKELIFYCLGGVRSTAAEDLAKTFGYTKRGNYIGSYEDWITHEIKKSES